MLHGFHQVCCLANARVLVPTGSQSINESSSRRGQVARGSILFEPPDVRQKWICLATAQVLDFNEFKGIFAGGRCNVALEKLGDPP